jgi:DNA-binding NtrC family response regulator
MLNLEGASPPQVDLLLRCAAAAAGVDWIALLPPKFIEDPRVREFVAAHCVDYQTIPIAVERLLFALGHAQGMASIAQLTREVPSRKGTQDLIGNSAPLQQVRQAISRMATSGAPVLVTGESGTGKELVAQRIHELSPRAARPFVAVNCASLPPTLIHAELFGYEKGAFTGANQRKSGHLESADGGTIFLDEIGDLDGELQALLLRFLEQGAVHRIGGRTELRLDVRVIAATHVDIEGAVRAGRFREDLYYRLNVLRIHTPSLRERPEDIRPLAEAFLARFAGERHRPVRGYSAAALAAMEAYQWPGNVRELMNRVRRAIVMADSRLIMLSDLNLAESVSDTGSHRTLGDARHDAERQTLLAALRESGGQHGPAAQLLGVSRATFYRLLARHSLGQQDVGGTAAPQECDTAAPGLRPEPPPA